MYQIRVFGKLTFPHFVSYTATEYKAVQTGTVVNDKTKEEEPIFNKVIGTGTYNLIANPEQPIQIGDKLAHPYYNGYSYTVTEINEQRQAKGDWSFSPFTPIMQQVTVELN